MGWAAEKGKGRLLGCGWLSLSWPRFWIHACAPWWKPTRSSTRSCSKPGFLPANLSFEFSGSTGAGPRQGPTEIHAQWTLATQLSQMTNGISTSTSLTEAKNYYILQNTHNRVLWTEFTLLIPIDEGLTDEFVWTHACVLRIQELELNFHKSSGGNSFCGYLVFLKSSVETVLVFTNFEIYFVLYSCKIKLLSFIC